MRPKILTIIGSILITACQPEFSTKSAPVTVSEIKSSKTERIETITQLLVTQEPLPSPLTNAYFLEEKIGDNQLGPSDYVSFGMLEIKPKSVFEKSSR